MQLLSANYAKAQFGPMIDMAQKEPFQIAQHNRVVGLMVLAQDHEDTRAFCANRLKHTLHTIAASVSARGLTQDKLDELLSDVS